MAGITRQQVQAINVTNVFNYKIVINDKGSILSNSAFKDFLPAISAQVPVGSVQSEKFEFLFPLAIATGKGAPTMSIVFIDDKKHTIRQFFQDWVDNKIMDNDTLIIKYLKDYVKDITIIKYGETTDIAYEDIFTVYPTGDMLEQYDSSSNAPYTLTVNFEIVGKKKAK